MPSRREVMAGGAGLLLARAARSQSSAGQVTGHAMAARAGEDVLRNGGNAVDAIVTAAFVAAVTALNGCGIGGYGGSMIVARPEGRVSCIDFNTSAPLAARPDLFDAPVDDRPPDPRSRTGWLSVGVPGTAAGLDRARQRFGTKPLSALIAPAIRLARDGFPLPAGLADAIRTARADLARFPEASRLLMPEGRLPAAGELHRNPHLALLLEGFAGRGSCEDLYRGDAAKTLARASRAGGGLLTGRDLESYRTLERPCLRWKHGEFEVCTPAPTSGGLTVLQLLAVLTHAGYPDLRPADDRAAHILVEAMRLVWHDRLRLLGDPEHARIPVRQLLSADHSQAQGRLVGETVATGERVPPLPAGAEAGGTVHLSAVDANGMAAALTLTHGDGFGSLVCVEPLGLLLGHGMSRFDLRPGHPNAIGPGKRPLHNMCPTIVLRGGRPWLALGGSGGRRIVTAVAQVLAHVLFHARRPEEAVRMPRFHTEGDERVTFDGSEPPAGLDRLRAAGYEPRSGPRATVSVACVGW